MVESQYMLDQIRYLGVFQTLQIRKVTFPARKSYVDFFAEYKNIFSSKLTIDEANQRQIAERELKLIGFDNNEFLLGTKRVYMSEKIE